MLRNDCLHFNAGFKSKSEADLKLDALASVNKLKAIYASIIGVTSYNTIDPRKLTEILGAITKEASTGSHDGVANIEDAVIRTRNVLAQVTGVDLSINLGGVPVSQWSCYQVEDIDFDAEPPEVTLRDIQNGLVVIVDLTEAEVKVLQSISLSDGEMILAGLISITNGLGISAEWRFVSNPTRIG